MEEGRNREGKRQWKGWDVHDMFFVPVLMWLVLWKF